MPRPSRRTRLAALCGAGALLLSGCAVIGDGGGASAVAGSGEEEWQSYNLVEPGVLTVCSDTPYAPFEFEQDGKLTGYDVELARAVAEKLNLETTFVDSSFEAIESGASLTGCDLNASGISITSQRERVMAFTSPVLNDDLVLMAAKDSGITSAADAGNRPVGVQAATTGARFAQEQGLNVVQYEDGGMQVQAVRAGNTDAVLGNQSVLGYGLRGDDRFHVVEEYSTGEQLAWAVAEDDALLLSAIDRALNELRVDGTMAALQEEWFGSAQEDYQ